MGTVNVEKMRKKILAERERLERSHARITDQGGAMSDSVSELAQVDPNHPGDVGSEMFEREKDVALHANVEGMLAQIDDALAKMDAGTYGICDRCGEPIAPARLEALPYATLCIDCQSYIEISQ